MNRSMVSPTSPVDVYSVGDSNLYVIEDYEVIKSTKSVVTANSEFMTFV